MQAPLPWGFFYYHIFGNLTPGSRDNNKSVILYVVTQKTLHFSPKQRLL